MPAGLGARDTLRLEVCYPLYGNDLAPERTPVEAGLRWACAMEKDFIGAERIGEQIDAGTTEKLVPFTLLERGVPRAGCEVIADGEHAGVVTSGTFSPCLEVGIGMAYVRWELASAGTEVEIDVRGKRRRARVQSKPLYKKES
jgi:glycine cleavage system T protein (aminomethyltransferase)